MRLPLALRAALLTLALAGCNAILDNQRGQLDPALTPTAVEPNEPAPDETGDDAGGDAAAAAGCAANQKRCGGVCVSQDDPAYGCARTSCAPCATANATATCKAGACAVKACDPGHDDCDDDPKNGCEVDLSSADSCGACGKTCGAAAPVCAPAGRSFACSTGCTPEAPLLCGKACVSPLTSVDHCGGCNVKCPTVPGGTETCQLGVCTLTCKAGSHACGGTRCAADDDVTACGPTCALCPAPPNGVALCTANACASACNAGFADCNAQPADGCETNLASDPHHCGACGIDCLGGTCVNQVCQPPPPAP